MRYRTNLWNCSFTLVYHLILSKILGCYLVLIIHLESFFSWKLDLLRIIERRWIDIWSETCIWFSCNCTVFFFPILRVEKICFASLKCLRVQIWIWSHILAIIVQFLLTQRPVDWLIVILWVSLIELALI